MGRGLGHVGGGLFGWNIRHGPDLDDDPIDRGSNRLTGLAPKLFDDLFQGS